MAKLKEGGRVAQKFVVSTRFMALAGDKRLGKKDIADALVGAIRSYAGAEVALSVRELKEAAVPA